MLMMKMKAVVVVLALMVVVCAGQGFVESTYTTDDEVYDYTETTYEQVSVSSDGTAEIVSSQVMVQSKKGNCYAKCSTNADCGHASAGCNTCVHGQCTCASGNMPCLELDFTSTGWFRYSCMNESATLCSWGAYGQKAGLCAFTCPYGKSCCDRLGSSCYDPKTSYCCAEQDSLFPVSCGYGNKCSPDPLLGNIQAVCTDIDECKQNSTICGSGYTCTNTNGSYTCNDINECTKNSSICGRGYTCNNSPGSYSCVDVNECTSATLNDCGRGYTCVNTPGSYSCSDVNECAQIVPVCNSNYTCENTAGSYKCNDINECEQADICGKGYACSNTVGGYNCNDVNECSSSLTNDCRSGYTCNNTQGGYTCVDINECAGRRSVCNAGYTCSNTEGSYTCDDIDECAQGTDDCRRSAFTCNNTMGGYVCVDINECLNDSACNAGYSCNNTIGSFECDDIDECALGECGSGFTCTNEIGSYMCTDINECVVNNPCNSYSTCQNTVGSWLCNPLPFYITSSMPGGLVLEPLGNSSVPGTIVGMKTKVTGKLSQLWKYSMDYFIQNVESNLVLDISGGAAVKNQPVVLWPKKDFTWSLNQNWIYNTTSKTFRSAAGSVVIDVYHADPSDGASLCVYPSLGQVNQQFSLQSGL